MPKIDQSVLYQTQISLTEWFENSNHKDSKKLRLEDNEKRERLKVLNEIINLPFDRPTQFSAKDLSKNPPEFINFLNLHQNELCALRLIPLDPKLPKLRIRGHTVKNVMNWFHDQKIDIEKYRAEFIPHSDNQLFATTFIINPKGIFGEVIKGGHYQLTQGFYDSGEPIIFSYDFKNWRFSKNYREAQKTIKDIIKILNIKNKKIQKLISQKLDSTFLNNYLLGYFEALITKEHGLWFIDYNRVLGDIYKDFQIKLNRKFSKQVLLKGLPASLGKVQGKVKILDENTKNLTDEILVCQMTTPDHLPLMKQALAIVTDMGGILSHAAIISRELGIPCITATKNATQVLKNGDLIEVDADNGIIFRLQ